MSSEARMSQDTSPGDSNTSAEDQLARKRARDRKSQKAMRDRTSWTIRSLMDQVTQLKQLITNEQDEKAALRTSLDTIAQQNNLLRAENDALRRRRLEDNRRLSIASTPAQSLWEILPINVPPTCASDTIFQTFIDRRRASLAAATASTSPISLEAAAADLNREVSEGPNMNCLLNLHPCDSTDTISHVVADVMKTYAEIGTPPKQVGCFYYMAKLLAWLILRTQETYEKMPAWLRPVPIQLEQPHPAWIDRIPWPNVRDYLVRRPEITFDEYVGAYSSSLSVWWPYDPSHVVIRVTSPQLPTSTTVVINPVYEDHCRRLKNWMVGERFRQRFPDIAALIDEHAAAATATASGGAGGGTRDHRTMSMSSTSPHRTRGDSSSSAVNTGSVTSVGL